MRDSGIRDMFDGVTITYHTAIPTVDIRASNMIGNIVQVTNESVHTYYY
jgi:hypothetical protein